MPEALYVFVVLGGVGFVLALVDGDFVRLANLAGWGSGLVVAGVVRWAYGRRSS